MSPRVKPQAPCNVDVFLELREFLHMSRFALWKQEWIDGEVKMQIFVLYPTTKEVPKAEKEIKTKN